MKFNGIFFNLLIVSLLIGSLIICSSISSRFNRDKRLNTFKMEIMDNEIEIQDPSDLDISEGYDFTKKVKVILSVEFLFE